MYPLDECGGIESLASDDESMPASMSHECENDDDVVDGADHSTPHLMTNNVSATTTNDVNDVKEEEEEEVEKDPVEEAQETARPHPHRIDYNPTRNDSIKVAYHKRNFESLRIIHPVFIMTLLVFIVAYVYLVWGELFVDRAQWSRG